jgi:hypothetical protein
LKTTDNIKTQTEALATQLKKLDNIPKDDDEQYVKELEIYNEMLKKADFSIESQAASKKRNLMVADKVLAPRINWATRQVNKVNKKLIKHNKRS